jgi:hypothetical protein
MAEARKAQEHEVRKGEGASFLSVQGATLGSGSRLPGTSVLQWHGALLFRKRLLQ